MDHMPGGDRQHTHHTQQDDERTVFGVVPHSPIPRVASRHTSRVALPPATPTLTSDTASLLVEDAGQAEDGDGNEDQRRMQRKEARQQRAATELSSKARAAFDTAHKMQLAARHASKHHSSLYMPSGALQKR